MYFLVFRVCQLVFHSHYVLAVCKNVVEVKIVYFKLSLFLCSGGVHHKCWLDETSLIVVVGWF